MHTSNASIDFVGSLIALGLSHALAAPVASHTCRGA